MEVLTWLCRGIACVCRGLWDPLHLSADDGCSEGATLSAGVLADCWPPSQFLNLEGATSLSWREKPIFTASLLLIHTTKCAEQVVSLYLKQLSLFPFFFTSVLEILHMRSYWERCVFNFSYIALCFEYLCLQHGAYRTAKITIQKIDF